MHHASYPVFVHRPAASDWASFRPRLTTTPLPFSLPSALRKPGHRSSTYEVTRHARRTRSRSGALRGFIAQVRCIAGLGVGSPPAVTGGTLGARLRCMNTHVDHILDEALGLPADERSALTVALLDSLEGSDDSSIAAAWREEIKARQVALRAGTVKADSWAEARARLSAL